MTETPEKKRVKVEDLDEAALGLLEAVNASKDLVERVKGFAAVTTWMQLRKELAPPKKELSKFERIQNRSRSGASERGGNLSVVSENSDNAGPPEPDDAA